MLIASQQRRTKKRCGAVLLAVLVVIVLMSLAAYRYSDLMFAEMKAAENGYRMAQAQQIADSGVHFMAAILSSPDGLASLGGNPYDNRNLVQITLPGMDQNLGAYFQIYSPPQFTDEPLRYGVTDESGKINLNMLLVQDPTGIDGFDILMKLPNMTATIANSILDWMDPDSDAREDGAENDHYSTLEPGYQAKNGPFESLEELLLVKGVTPELVYGVPADGVAGWTAYLTIYSREQNVSIFGGPMIDLNQSDLGALYQELAPEIGEEMAKFIALFRLYGPSNSSGQRQSLAGSIIRSLDPTPEPDNSNTTYGDLGEITEDMFLDKKGKSKIRSLFELVDTQVAISSGRGSSKKSVVYESPLNSQEMLRETLPILFSFTTATVDVQEMPARVNCNTAPYEVLSALFATLQSGEEIAETILANRPVYTDTEAPDPIYDTPAWLVSEANLSPTLLRDLEPYLTTKTQVYRVHVLGRFEDITKPMVHLETVIDTNAGRPRILYWRDLTELGTAQFRKGPE